MFLKFKVSCTCNCEYTVNEDASVDKIVCPNCGMEHPYSAKLVSILNIAKEIPDTDFLSECVETKVIPYGEDMKSCQ
jgi:transposase